jgi:hypothetical protein
MWNISEVGYHGEWRVSWIADEATSHGPLEELDPSDIKVNGSPPTKAKESDATKSDVLDMFGAFLLCCKVWEVNDDDECRVEVEKKGETYEYTWPQRNEGGETSEEGQPS